MEFERRLIDPFGVNRELQRLPYGFEDIDSQATGLFPGGAVHAKQFFSKRFFHSRQRLEMNDEVERQSVTYSTPKARTTFPCEPPMMPAYPEATYNMPPATTGPAHPNEPPLASTPFTVLKSWLAL
jgi:hypothetical protein